jgi:hypothetical protein
MQNNNVLFSSSKNIKKQKYKKIPAEKYKEIMNDIKNLHNSTCEGSYQLSLKIMLSRWKKDKSLDAFVKYFKK